MTDRNEVSEQIAEARKQIAALYETIADLKRLYKELPKKPPTGGRGKGRKHHLKDKYKDRLPLWNDMDQLEIIANLFFIAQDMPELKTQIAKEKWIAEQTGIWGSGTVHVQVYHARRQGLIPNKRYKP
jgi:hypothetical protein